MTKNEKVELMLDIERWKIREFQDAEDVDVINLGETNAEYDDNIIFGVDCSLESLEIVWYINRMNPGEEFTVGECLFETKKTFGSKKELVDFIFAHSFDELLGDEYYEASGMSKYSD